MNRLLTASAVVLACLLAGCAGEIVAEGLDEEDVAEAQSALIADNALVGNALVGNALVGNALVGNALVGNALSPSAMAALQDPTAAGDRARAFVRYTVSCALHSSKSFNFSWTDASGKTHDESYPGLLNVAPGWATGPLTNDSEKRMVSGCVAARVNYSGTNVVISARSLREPLKTLCNSVELVDYPHIEGAFWGNLFTSAPYLNACYNAPNVDLSRQAKRECAAGHLENGQTLPCGPIVLRGSCANWCQTVNGAGQYYPSCVDKPGVPNSPTTKDVVTTALP
jgi:hypothetical protein